MADETPKEVVFHYIKSNHFRVVHVDGAWGGVTPQKNITISFFSERPAIPQQIVNKINEGGVLGDEIPEKRVSRSGYVREVEVDLVFGLEVAERLKAWLENRIALIKDLKSRDQSM